MSEWIILFHIELIIIANFIIAIAVSIQAYTEWKMYKITKQREEERRIERIAASQFQDPMV